MTQAMLCNHTNDNEIKGNPSILLNFVYAASYFVYMPRDALCGFDFVQKKWVLSILKTAFVRFNIQTLNSE